MKHLRNTLAVVVVFYVGIAFILLELDFREWTEGIRSAYAIAVFTISVLIALASESIET